MLLRVTFPSFYNLRRWYENENVRQQYQVASLQYKNMLACWLLANVRAFWGSQKSSYYTSTTTTISNFFDQWGSDLNINGVSVPFHYDFHCGGLKSMKSLLKEHSGTFSSYRKFVVDEEGRMVVGGIKFIVSAQQREWDLRVEASCDFAMGRIKIGFTSSENFEK